jgi:hypothetical protein
MRYFVSREINLRGAKNLAVINGHKEGSCLVFERDGKVVKFDFRDKGFYSVSSSGRTRKIQPPQEFFRKVEVEDIAAGFREESYGKFIRIINTAETRCSNVATLLDRLPDYAQLESYILLGISFTTHKINRQRPQWTTPQTFTKEASHYNKEVLMFMRECQITFLNNNWEKSYLANVDLITNLCTHIRRKFHLDLEVYRWMHDLVTGYGGLDIFKSMLATYGCEYKTLFDYLVRADRVEALNFGSALTTLRDLHNMSRGMGKTSFDKYPHYLKMVHDIVQRNFRTHQAVYEEATFKNMVNQDLEYVGLGYKVLVPTETKDVKDEGNALNHCVASYIRRILEGTTQIVFLRKEAEESLITIEVTGNRIIQARGLNNRTPTAEEKNWIRLYAKAKGLTNDV